MKIAQVSPLFESVPPKLYGGTERVVSYLTEELVRQGHDVTLFASGDSQTAARLIAPCREALRLNPHCNDRTVYHMLQLEMVLQRAVNFDIIHYHTDYLHFPSSRHAGVTHVTTLHGRLDLHDLIGLYQVFNDLPLVSISNSQREPFPHVNWATTIPHGLPANLYHLNERPGDYLAFLGRISPEKRLDRAIEIARATGLRLKVAAKIDAVDRQYYEETIAPMMDDPLIEYLGEIGEREKDEFLGGARALLFPIDWCEPFGLVMIEAFACGTPVVAFRRGSVPEVLDEGLTGFIVEDIAGAIAAVHKVGQLDRRRVRETFDRRFTVARMAADYARLYQRIIEEHRSGAARPPRPVIAPVAEALLDDPRPRLHPSNGHHPTHHGFPSLVPKAPGNAPGKSSGMASGKASGITPNGPKPSPPMTSSNEDEELSSADA